MLFPSRLFLSTVVISIAMENHQAMTNSTINEPICKLTEIRTLLNIISQHIATVQSKLPGDFKDFCGNIPSTVNSVDRCDCEASSSTGKPFDCSDIYLDGNGTDGIYEIWPQRKMSEGPLPVYCDMTTDGGGWTVIQRRGDFNNSYDYFDHDWVAYKIGFGDVSKEFWLGNSNIYALTSQRSYQLRIDLGDWDGNITYATYSQFWIGNELHNYALHINGYNGTAGDALLGIHKGREFTTKDRDNDEDKSLNCASRWKGGWWYRKCYSSNLNGPYRRGTHVKHLGGVHWYEFRGFEYSLKDTVMMIRPTDFEAKLSN